MLSNGWNIKINILIFLSILVLYALESKVVSAIDAKSMNIPVIDNMYTDIVDYKWIETSFGKQPAFCHNSECPKYKILCKNNFFEVRKYEPSKWAKTPVRFVTKLDKYFKDANIRMTVPVMLNIAESDPQGSMLYYIPSQLNQHTPDPGPIDENVAIAEHPELVMYVKMFGGYVLSGVWRQLAERFLIVLGEYRQITNPVFGFNSAIYDNSSTLINRHNEILYLAAAEKIDEKYCQ